MADLNRLAARIVRQATEPEDDAPTLAQTNGRKGGLKGGKVRAERMTPEQRSEAAKRAAQVRWTREAEA